MRGADAVMTSSGPRSAHVPDVPWARFVHACCDVIWGQSRDLAPPPVGPPHTLLPEYPRSLHLSTHEPLQQQMATATGQFAHHVTQGVKGSRTQGGNQDAPKRWLGMYPRLASRWE